MRKYLFSFFLIIVLQQCAPHIAPYNQRAYENATSLKVETVMLVNKGTESYLLYEDQVEQVELKLNQAYEYVKGIPKNDLSAKQWQILIDPEGNLAGGYFKRWAEKDSLSAVFVKEAAKLISSGFDKIIELEAAKIK